MAKRSLEQIAEDNLKRLHLISLEKARLDHLNALHVAKQEGLEEGIEKGIQKGIEIGEAKARREQTQKIARTMAQAGMSEELIAKMLDVTVGEVRDLLP